MNESIPLPLFMRSGSLSLNGFRKWLSYLNLFVVRPSLDHSNDIRTTWTYVLMVNKRQTHKYTHLVGFGSKGLVQCSSLNWDEKRSAKGKRKMNKNRNGLRESGCQSDMMVLFSYFFFSFIEWEKRIENSQYKAKTKQNKHTYRCHTCHGEIQCCHVHSFFRWTIYNLWCIGIVHPYIWIWALCYICQFP